jgi:anti-sigma B factor antagonist
MDITIEERAVADVTVLDLAGRLTIDRGAQLLKDTVDRLVAQARTRVLLNLRDVSYIDSGGLGQLVASYSSVVKAGGAMKLLSVNARNHDLLSITRLVTLFQSFDSEIEALGSFADGAPLPLFPMDFAAGDGSSGPRPARAFVAGPGGGSR